MRGIDAEPLAHVVYDLLSEVVGRVLPVHVGGDLALLRTRLGVVKVLKVVHLQPVLLTPARLAEPLERHVKVPHVQPLELGGREVLLVVGRLEHPGGVVHAAVLEDHRLKDIGRRRAHQLLEAGVEVLERAKLELERVLLVELLRRVVVVELPLLAVDGGGELARHLLVVQQVGERLQVEVLQQV